MLPVIQSIATAQIWPLSRIYDPISISDLLQASRWKAASANLGVETLADIAGSLFQPLPILYAAARFLSVCHVSSRRLRRRKQERN